jgi:hypothetical protein
MEAQQAKAELEATRRGVQGVTQATDGQTRASRTSTSATDANTSAKQRNRQATDSLARSQTMAAGATGNLVAQFNDIGMMLAAGQNPLQLAIQQGTQITQVIGPMGATGAVQALGGALMGMLSPINLVTLGVIAAGAAMVQWLTGSTKEAATLKEQIRAVNDAVKAWRDESGKSLDDLRKTFGAITPEVVAMQREINQLRIADIVREADAAARQLADTLGSGIFASVGGDIRRLFLESGIVLGTSQTAEFRALLDDIRNATGIRDQLAAVQALREEFAQITGGIQNMSAGQREFYSTLLDTESALRAAAVATGEIDTKTQDAARAATELASRAQAVVAAISSADGSKLVSAFQAAFPVASQLLGMAQGIVATIGAASAKAAAFESAETAGLAAQYALYGAGRVAGERLARESGALYGGRRVIPAPAGKGTGRSGAGAAAARDEADALQELIAGLEAEIEALRVTDPIQQEMLQHRKALAGATEEELQKVEALIAARERERAAMEAAQAMQEYFESTLESSLDALIVKGESLNDVLKQIIVSLMKAIVQAAIFGSGPLGGLFGGGGLGKLIFGGFADGGVVRGPGTGTSDDVPILASNGEFVVNARATQKNRHLLEAINAGGRIHGFAGGGHVGADNRRLAGRGLTGDTTININLAGAKGDREIEAMARKGTQAALREYDREALPSSVKRVSGDPRRFG